MLLGRKHFREGVSLFNYCWDSNSHLLAANHWQSWSFHQNICKKRKTYFFHLFIVENIFRAGWKYLPSRLNVWNNFLSVRWCIISSQCVRSFIYHVTKWVTPQPLTQPIRFHSICDLKLHLFFLNVRSFFSKSFLYKFIMTGTARVIRLLELRSVAWMKELLPLRLSADILVPLPPKKKKVLEVKTLL